MRRSTIHLGIAVFAVLMIAIAAGYFILGQPEAMPAPQATPAKPIRKQFGGPLDIKGPLTPVERVYGITDPVYACFTNHILDNDIPSLKSNFASFIIEKQSATAHIYRNGKAEVFYLTLYETPYGTDIVRKHEGKTQTFRVFRGEPQKDGTIEGWAVQMNPNPKDECEIRYMVWRGSDWKPQTDEGFQLATGTSDVKVWGDK